MQQSRFMFIYGKGNDLMIPHSEGWLGTCSVDNPKDRHVTFARNREYLWKLYESGVNVGVFVPNGIDVKGIPLDHIKLYECSYFEYEFAIFHNEINRDREPEKDVLSIDIIIHPTAVIADGIHEVNGPAGHKIHLKHMGNVVIGSDVRIGPMSFIERACFDSTIIEDGVRIDGLCAIGHNSIIGKNTVIASGVGVGGSCEIGRDCWIGGNTYIRNGIKVYSRVVIGCGSAVVKNITEPGIYAGVPAVFKKPYVEGWNF